MSKLFHARYRLLALSILILVLGAATYGFAAANTVDTSQAGEGSGGISGYSVTNIEYTLDASDPTAFTMVEFDLDATAGEVHVGLGDGGGNIEWFNTCTDMGGDHWECDLTGATTAVADAVQLHVASAD